jgi:hypothetical protein
MTSRREARERWAAFCAAPNTCRAEYGTRHPDVNDPGRVARHRPDAVRRVVHVWVPLKLRETGVEHDRGVNYSRETRVDLEVVCRRQFTRETRARLSETTARNDLGTAAL